jgi:hypothetical protein
MVETELKLHVLDVVFGFIASLACILGYFPVLRDLLFHFSARSDLVARDPVLELGESLASPQPADQLVCDSQEDAD